MFHHGGVTETPKMRHEQGDHESESDMEIQTVFLGTASLLGTFFPTCQVRVVRLYMIL